MVNKPLQRIKKDRYTITTKCNDHDIETTKKAEKSAVPSASA
jgi:hypothetical protein